MTDWREPPLPERRDDEERDEREPDMTDPEAQRAPGDDSTGKGRPGEHPPPMQARPGESIEMDAAGSGYEAVGTDNIRDGSVGGVMGTPHAGRGQGQGG
jgi:hypothetical protein